MSFPPVTRPSDKAVQTVVNKLNQLTGLEHTPQLVRSCLANAYAVDFPEHFDPTFKE